VVCPEGVAQRTPKNVEGDFSSARSCSTETGKEREDKWWFKK